MLYCVYRVYIHSLVRSFVRFWDRVRNCWIELHRKQTRTHTVACVSRFWKTTAHILTYKQASKQAWMHCIRTLLCLDWIGCNVAVAAAAATALMFLPLLLSSRSFVLSFSLILPFFSTHSSLHFNISCFVSLCALTTPFQTSVAALHFYMMNVHFQVYACEWLRIKLNMCDL